MNRTGWNRRHVSPQCQPLHRPARGSLSTFSSSFVSFGRIAIPMSGLEAGLLKRTQKAQELCADQQRRSVQERLPPPARRRVLCGVARGVPRGVQGSLTPRRKGATSSAFLSSVVVVFAAWREDVGRGSTRHSLCNPFRGMALKQSEKPIKQLQSPASHCVSSNTCFPDSALEATNPQVALNC
jgi:hypothetical protein